MIPKIGQMVQYTLAPWDSAAVYRRRRDFQETMTAMHWVGGAQAHVGNTAVPGDVFPALVIKAWGQAEGSMCNLQVFLDGNDVLWVTSCSEGEGESHWQEIR